MDVTQATPAATFEVPSGLAPDMLRRTGVAVTFYGPDGQAAGEVAAQALETLNETLRQLVGEAFKTGEDQVVASAGWVRAAWPIRVRSRTVLVAAAEVPVSGEQGPDLGRRLLAAVAEAVRAHLCTTEARTECEAVSETLLQSFEEISLLHHLGEVLRVSRPVTELLKYACNELRETVDAEAAVAFLPEAEEGAPETVVAGQLPFPAADLPRIMMQLLEGASGEACIVIHNYCQQDPALAGLAPGMKRVALVPIELSEGRRGALAAINREAEEFGSPDAKLIRSTSNVTSIVIENRRLYRELQELMLDLVRSLVSSIDAKDPYTCGHSERVAITARRVAIQMRLPAEQVEQIYLAGLLHDIGKIGTPEQILRKEGKLEAEEWRIMKQHPTVGHRILAGIRKLESIRDVVLSHHERLDGKGYPAGLKGDEIPLLARIVGIADAFDAMTSNRPYRPMLPMEYVKKEIERCIGTQFDVRAAEALLSLDMTQLMKEFAERPTVGLGAG
jgi:putative nucleotidyltransferase with HDIG domain